MYDASSDQMLIEIEYIRRCMGGGGGVCEIESNRM